MGDDSLGVSLQAELERNIEDQHIPGAAAVVSIAGKGRFPLGAGFEDLPKTRRIRSNARFLIYSITKTFIGVTILRLVQQNLLTLDDRLSAWCPEINIGSAITIRHLLNHSSGLPDYGCLTTYQNAVLQESIEPWSFDEFMTQTCKRGLAFEPGTSGGYSNIGYMLLTRIIERAACKTFRLALDAEILIPLQLSSTSLISSPEDFQTVTPGYSDTNGKGQLRDVREWYHPGWVAHGVIASTTDDVNRFLEALFDGLLLDSQPLSDMLSMVPIHGRPPISRAAYGLGIASETDALLGTHYGHEGSGPGYRVIASHLPELQSTTIAVFCNKDDCNPRTISDALARTVAQSLKEK